MRSTRGNRSSAITVRFRRSCRATPLSRGSRESSPSTERIGIVDHLGKRDRVFPWWARALPPAKRRAELLVPRWTPGAIALALRPLVQDAPLAHGVPIVA